MDIGYPEYNHMVRVLRPKTRDLSRLDWSTGIMGGRSLPQSAHRP